MRRLYLTDTLADPYVEETIFGSAYEPIARSRRAANEIKRSEPVLVCLGNPPYDRHPVTDQLGGWVRFGHPNADRAAILGDFRSEDREVNLYAVNLYNLYVYFWRWALWKVFEAHAEDQPGVVCFITAASFLDGPGYAEMRAHMRRDADDIWIIDVSPEGHQPRVTTRLFPGVQQPLCICLLLRTGIVRSETPATVRRLSIRGTRAQKFTRLGNVQLDEEAWQNCRTGWRDIFDVPAGLDWLAMPALLDVLPWGSPGVKSERDWVIAPNPATLQDRWTHLVSADPGRRNELLKVSRGRDTTSAPRFLPGLGAVSQAMPALTGETATSTPTVRPYSYRSFDRQWIIADHRVLSQARPDLWSVATAPGQLFLTTQHAQPIPNGPVITSAAYMPDNHHYRGSFAGIALPLWRDAQGTVPNVLPGLIQHLSDAFGRPVTGPDVFAYLAAVLAHPGFLERFPDLTKHAGPRVPLTLNADLFTEATRIGRRVLWLQTYGERYADPAQSRPDRDIPRGNARVHTGFGAGPVPSDFSYDEPTQTISVGTARIAPVEPAVWAYRVSGMRIVNKWLGYRTGFRHTATARQSPLSADTPDSWDVTWTRELLELLWMLEALCAEESAQAELLGRICDGPLLTVEGLTAAGLLPPSAGARAPSGGVDTQGEQLLFDQ